MDLLDRMATFVDIVDAGTLSAAARRQRLSLAAVSRQLAALERELGTSLILRTTRALQVTPAGRQLYDHAVRALREVEIARASVRGAGGALRVSAGVSLGLERLVPIVAELAAAHPALAIELRLEEHASDLVRDGVDVALRAGLAPPDSTAYIARELTRFPRWVVAAPRYLRAHGTPKTPQALAKHAAIIQVSDAGDLASWTLGDTSVRVRGALRCTTPTAIRELAAAGCGIALLPDWLVAADLAAGRLRRVLPDHATPPVVLWALHRIELRDAPRVRAFLDHVTRAFAYHRSRA
jgi:DNA-binding transcriptional LysR family regulator